MIALAYTSANTKRSLLLFGLAVMWVFGALFGLVVGLVIG